MAKVFYEDLELDPEVIARRHELFEKFVVPYFNMIYKLCIRYSFSSENVEENYTEVLVNFYRRIETYDTNKSIKTWLHIVTKRMVHDLDVKRKKYDNRDGFSDIANCQELYSDEPTANHLGIDNYRQYYSDDILSVLDEMKSIHRDALILQEAGYSVREIADIEFAKGTLKNYNIETIKSRLRLARKYLKQRINRNGERIV